MDEPTAAIGVRQVAEVLDLIGACAIRALPSF
jgi:ABC-type sugar transport system ATPase subunit